MTTPVTATVTVVKLSDAISQHLTDTVVREFPLTIVLNDKELVTLLCSPQHLDYLAIGFLASEGLLNSKEDIKRLVVDEPASVVEVEALSLAKQAGDVSRRIITSGCGRGVRLYSTGGLPPPVNSETRLSATEIFALMREFQQRCTLFQATGGTHAAALCSNSEILVFHEDIGRHNALDKVLGQCLLDGIATEDRLLLTSGRVSSEVVLKAARRNIPLLVSKSAPTDLAVKLAQDLSITLLGFVRGTRMNIYANGWRITNDERQGK